MNDDLATNVQHSDYYPQHGNATDVNSFAHKLNNHSYR